MNTKLHAVTDTSGRPIRLFITAGQVSDYTGAAALIKGLPEADWLLADRRYDADWFRETLVDKGTKPCIPGRTSRKKTVKCPSRDIAAQYPAGQGISADTNAATASLVTLLCNALPSSDRKEFGRLKDWRRISTRYDRSPTVFLSAIALAAAVIFWLCVLTLALLKNAC